MKVVGVTAPWSQLVLSRIQAVGRQSFGLAWRVKGQLPQTGTVHLDFVQSQRVRRRGPVAKDNSLSVERQIKPVEDAARQLGTQLRDLAGCQIQNAQIASRGSCLHEFGIVPAGAVRMATHEQDLARSKQRVAGDQRARPKLLQQKGHRVELLAVLAPGFHGDAR